MIYVIGDSHARSYYLRFQINNIEIGPATAHNLINPHSKTQSQQKIQKFMNEHGKNHRYVFLFGEIDCNVHFYYWYMKNNRTPPLRNYIVATVKRYITFLKRLREQGYTVAVLTIPPAGPQKNTYRLEYFASFALRIQIYIYYNKKLKSYCRRNSIPVLDFFDKVADENNALNMSLAKDDCHLKPDAVYLLLEELGKIGWV
jgi:hypothetical protein